MASQIVLRSDVARVGRAGETVMVADGYARNYLVPRGLAFLATVGSVKHAAQEASRASARQAKQVKVARELADRMQKVECTIKKSAGAEGKLFGTVTPAEIAKALKAKGFEVDKRMLKLTEPIKALGVYTVPIHLAPEVEAKIKVWVEKE